MIIDIATFFAVSKNIIFSQNLMLSMNDLIQLVYSSTASDAMHDHHLDKILTQSRTNNQSRQITGMLLYSNMHFIQVLEGSEQAVNTTFEKISLDSRHTDIITHKEEFITKRDFPIWAMGYHKLDATEYRQLKNYFPVFNQSIDNELFFKNPNETKKMLLDFILERRDIGDIGHAKNNGHLSHT